MSLPNPADLISQMATDLAAHLKKRNISEPRFIGIRTGGIWVAQALQEALGRQLKGGAGAGRVLEEHVAHGLAAQ